MFKGIFNINVIMPNRKNAIYNNIILYNNMSKKRISNTKYLNILGRNASANVKDKVDELIQLYSNGQISQMRTAENLIFNLINPDKRTLNAAIKRYNKSIEKIKQHEPLKQRLSKKSTQINEYLLDVLFFTNEYNYNGSRKPDFKRHGMSYFTFGMRAYKQFTVKMSGSSFPQEFLKKYITDHINDEIIWKKIIKILETDQDFKDWYTDKQMSVCINALFIKSAESIKKQIHHIIYSMKI